MSSTDDHQNRIYRELGLKRLNPLWAKFEILFGLFAVGAGIVGTHAMNLTAHQPPIVWLLPILLIALGGYLALAGHRSHLYQSNNRLVAYLADLIRQQPPRDHP
jgi:hypothetical protein